MKIKKYILLLLFCFILTELHSQGELETDRAPDNYNVNLFGLNLNSNGYGLVYNFTTRINYWNRNIYNVDFNILKSSKEIKVVNPYFDALSVRKFVFGKTYSVVNLRTGYGINRMLFDKRDKNSISIHLTSNLGLSLALSKPIYYEIVDSIGSSNGYVIAYTSYNKIDINLQNNPTDIIGKAPFLMGLDEIRFHPGIYVKLGFLVDFSNDVMKSRELETGIQSDFYLKPIEIMAGEENKFFLSLFLSYKFGKKYDARLNREFRKEMKKNN